MGIATERLQDLVVVAVTGDLDAENAVALREAGDVLLLQRNHNFVIDLSDVGLVSGAGLAALVELFKRVRIGEGDVRVCGLRPPVRRIFELTHLDRVFDTFDGREPAVASFRPGGRPPD